MSTSLGQPFSIADQGVQEYTVEPGAYQVTERATDGWTLSGGTCDDGDSSWNGATLTANVAAGETVTCTFNNTQNAVPAPAVVQPPAQGVAPVQVRPASAQPRRAEALRDAHATPSRSAARRSAR